MFKKSMMIILGIFLLSGCSDSFREYFKKSSNNKLVDRKGFSADKRAPLYNKKYIAAAKRNVIEENFDDEEEDLLSEYDTETINPTLRNRQMYLKMVKQDAESIRQQQSNETKKRGTSLAIANNKVRKKNEDNSHVELQKELNHIKAMLNETQKNLEKYRCPTMIPIPQNNNIQNSEIILPNKLEDEKYEKDRSIKEKSSVKSEVKKKFLTEDFDGTIKNSPLPHRISNTVIEEYEKSESPPREI